MSPLGYYKRKKRDKPMRARTYIYIVGMAALTLQGCCKKSHPNTPDVERHAIGMAAQSVTRALIEDIGDLSEFAVYGYKQGPNNGMVFTDQRVTHNGNAWEYTPVKYWSEGTYSFTAYAPTTVTPQSGCTYTHDANNRPLPIGLPYWQLINGEETDIVVATSQGAATTYLNTYGGQVALNFDHLYAQLVVKVVRSASFQNTYKLTSLTYQYVPTADGTATYTLDYTTPANSAWSDVALSAASKNAYSNADGEVINSNPEDTPTAKHLVVPFAGSDEIQVTVGYIVNDGLVQTGTASTGIKQLEAGKRYVLTLSLGSGAVIEPSLDIEQWIEVQDEQDIEVEEDDKHNW